MTRHTIPARFIVCCDLDDSDYKHLCHGHFFHYKLIHSLMESTMPLDPKVKEALRLCTFGKLTEAKKDGK